jgi:unsaturated rhamnogalacturonyl hydrolase
MILIQVPMPAQPAPDGNGAGKVIALDVFYNHQVDKSGTPYHYIWQDTKNSGFSQFGDVFKSDGAQITTIAQAPTADDLKKTSIYMICNPSIPENAANGKPNYIEEPAISTIEAWVKQGGVLLLLANDPGKCEFQHFNLLASRFGMTFDGNLRNSAPTTKDRPHATFLRDRDHFPDHPIFAGLDAAYMKEVTSIAVKSPATPILVVKKDPVESVKTDDGVGPDKDIIVAEAKIGKGLVVAVGDPWVYNEYFDPPKNWDKSQPWSNDKAAHNLASYLLKNASPPQAK